MEYIILLAIVCGFIIMYFKKSNTSNDLVIEYEPKENNEEYVLAYEKWKKELNKKIETVFLMSDPDKQVISSKFVKEIAKFTKLKFKKINQFKM